MSVYEFTRETTYIQHAGLDVATDSILQIACIVTNGRLTETIEGEEIAIHHDDETLNGMNEWCQEHHGKSGLVDAVRRSRVTMEEAEERVLAFVKQYAEPNSPIAGNSVHVDVQFLKKWMPRLYEYAHYRIVDVSTVGELCSRWYRKEHNKAPRKKGNHTAMSDIRESIEQLKYYRSAIFK